MGAEGLLTGLSFLGAGMGGVAGGLQYNDKKRMEEEQLRQKEEIVRLQNEIKLMIASINEGGRNQRWENPSGNVTAQQQGATTRNAATNAVTTRGQDISKELGLTRDATQRYGIDTGATTTRRGQDIGAETTRRGQDIGATTTRRGQDIGAATTIRGQDVGAATAGANRKSAEQIAAEKRANDLAREKIRSEGKTRGLEFLQPQGSAGDTPPPPSPEAAPTEIVNPPVDRPMPSSPEASSDQAERISAQLQAALQRLAAATRPDARAAATAEVKRLRDQLRALVGKSGG